MNRQCNSLLSNEMGFKANFQHKMTWYFKKWVLWLNIMRLQYTTDEQIRSLWSIWHEMILFNLEMVLVKFPPQKCTRFERSSAFLRRVFHYNFDKFFATVIITHMRSFNSSWVCYDLSNISIESIWICFGVPTIIRKFFHKHNDVNRNPGVLGGCIYWIRL